MVFVAAQLPCWDDDAKLLWQSDVCDQVIDQSVQRYLAELQFDDDQRAVTGQWAMNHKHKLKELVLWYALYCHWAQFHRGLPVSDLKLDDEGSALLDRLLKATYWAKLVTAQAKKWKVIVLGSVDGRSQSESWRRHLEKPSGHSAADDVSTEDLFQSILDDV